MWDWMGDILKQCCELQPPGAWVRFCLENGANPHLNLDFHTHSTLSPRAARYASIDVMSLILKYDSKLNGSGRATWEAGYVVRFYDKGGRLLLMKIALESGVDRNETGLGWDRITSCLKRAGAEVLNYLLDSGANPNLTGSQR